MVDGFNRGESESRAELSLVLLELWMQIGYSHF